MKDEVDFLPADKHQKFLQIDTIIFLCVARHAQIIQNVKFVISLQYLKKEVSNEVDFLHADKHENRKIAISLQYLKKKKKKLGMKLIFLHVDKHQNFLQVYFNTLDIRVSLKVILSLFMGMTKHSQPTQNNKFVISLQYLKKKVRNRVCFLHADKHQNFYNLALLFSMKVARCVQSTQNMKLVIFLKYIKKNMLQLLLCSILLQNIAIFQGGPVMFVVTCFFLFVFFFSKCCSIDNFLLLLLLHLMYLL